MAVYGAMAVVRVDPEEHLASATADMVQARREEVPQRLPPRTLQA